jgi:hypothetical protein
MLICADESAWEFQEEKEIDLILGKLAGGMTYEEVMSEYDVKKEDILAVLD